MRGGGGGGMKRKMTMMMIATRMTHDHVDPYDNHGDDDDDEDHLNKDKDGLSLITMGCDYLPVMWCRGQLHEGFIVSWIKWRTFHSTNQAVDDMLRATSPLVRTSALLHDGACFWLTKHK